MLTNLKCRYVVKPHKNKNTNKDALSLDSLNHHHRDKSYPSSFINRSNSISILSAASKFPRPTSVFIFSLSSSVEAASNSSYNKWEGRHLLVLWLIWSWSIGTPQYFVSGSAWIHVKGDTLDPEPNERCRSGRNKKYKCRKNPVKTLVKDLLELLCKGFLVYFVIQ